MALYKQINILHYALTIFSLLVGFATSEDTMLNINLKKPISVVSEKFLSITLDPVVFFNSDSLNDVEKTTSMAKALAPAYVRIAGPRSNSYIFERGLYPHQIQADPGYTFSETHWVQLHQWAERSGLDVIACITPQQAEINNNNNNARTSFWDPRNALDLISFTDHMGYNTSWQLGYECQTRCDVSGGDLGRDVQRLRNMIEAFPRYAEHGLIVGPDVVTYKTRQQQQYLQDYFNAAISSLSAVTWHPDFASISLETDGVSMHYDNLAFEKDNFYRAIGRHIAKKPLWIAESRPEECKQQFLGALVWARRLGNSAKLGLQVLMRQPYDSNLFRPTPDYWVSVLHKMLVGREVLDTKITTGNRTHVHFYCQCTNPSSKYERGSLTVFGINLTPSKITAGLKGIKLKVIHKYILMPGYDTSNRMFAETVLLNNEPLSLINGKEVPDLQPIISSTDKGVKLKLQSGGIGFWVLPGLKVKSCMGHEDEVIEKNLLRKINRRFEESEVDIETEPDDENNRETGDVGNSMEERKPALRLQRTTQKRLSLRRNIRHKEDERDDLDEKKSRKLDGARLDFDRLEKIMRKKDHHSVNLKSGGTHRVFENSDEDDNGSSEEGVFTKPISGQKGDSGEIIRGKLQEYKKRLNDYESRKKHRELISNLPKERVKNEIDDSVNKGMDTEKVIEALTLITKVENAMKGLEKENESEIQITSEIPTLGTSDSNDVNAGLQQSNNVSQRGDDVLLDEVLNTEKSKRTSVPTRIEDQLKALYRLLSEEKERRDNLSSQRQRRDLDKRIGDDPLGLRRDNIFLRKRMKNEEAKERFMERINERKQRLRERQDLKREKEELRKESRESDENTFYGFQHREPLKNFPEGDVYLQTGNDSNEKKTIDYKYVDSTNSNQQLYQQQARRNWKRSNSKTHQDGHENTWLEEGEIHEMPNEYYENVKQQSLNTKENLKDYGELWEAESINKDEQNQKNNNESADLTNHEIVTENVLPIVEDRKAKEKTVKQLLNYYETNHDDKDYDFDELRKNQQKIQYESQTLPSKIVQNNQQNRTLINKEKYQMEEKNKYTDPARYYINPSNAQPSKSFHYREKRYINNLEDLLRQEMITQDDNNLRDCQCRVIRGIEECKDCDMNQQNIYDSQLITKLDQQIRNYANNYINKHRFRRELNEKTNIGSISKPINSTSQSQNAKLVSSKKKIEDSAHIVNADTIVEDYNKTKEMIESVTVKIEDPLKLENDSNKKIWNRLPRKIENSAKFLFKTGEISSTAVIKINPQTNQQNDSNITNNSTNNNYVPVDNETETPIEHVANIRSIDTESSQRLITPPFKKIFDKDTFSKKQSSRSVGDKNSAADLEVKEQIKEITKDNINDEKDVQNTNEQTTNISIKSNSSDIQNGNDTTSKTLTSKNINETIPDSKFKLKNNSSTKIDERLKSRQARLTTRAEALAALKKENESRRTKKMIETSMKLIDIEKSKFAEYQKRRHDQLERLKRKLRAKREKMLQQYRTELLEAINESSESKESNIQRRDLLEKLQAAGDELEKNDRITDPDQRAYEMTYSSIKSDGLEKPMSTYEIVTPYHEVNRRQVIPAKEIKTYTEDNGQFKINNDRKRSILLEKQIKNENFYDTSGEQEQEFRVMNKKRSPYGFLDRDTIVENHNFKNFDDLNENDDQYYIPRQQDQNEQYQQTSDYYPHVMYNDETVIPVNVQYSQQPINTQQAHIDYYKINPPYIQEKSNEPLYQINPMNPMQHGNYYDMNGDNVQDEFDINKYYEINQKITPNEQQLEETTYKFNTPAYEEIDKEPIEQNYQKSKRSNLKIYEINPTMYKNDNSNLNSQELFMRPLPRYPVRRHNQNLYRYINRRYRREAVLNKEQDEYKPISFSQGIENSKTTLKKCENTETPDNLIRKKRLVNEIYVNKIKIPLENRLAHRNKIKNNYETDFGKNKQLTSTKRTKKMLESFNDSTNKNIYKKFNSLNDAQKIKKYNFNNYLNEIKNKDLSMRQKRALDRNYDYQIIESNGIDRLKDPEIDDIWNNIVKIKQDEKLLDKYDRQNNNIIKNLLETQHNLQNFIEPDAQSSNNEKNLTIPKTTESTTQINIESILVDTIPKLQTVITGGLKKAENLTSSIEELIDNFDNKLSDTTEYLKENEESTETFETNNKRENHNVFKTMVETVKKFFGIVSGIANIFHRQ